jgi:hypothetical protein
MELYLHSLKRAPLMVLSELNRDNRIVTFSIVGVNSLLSNDLPHYTESQNTVSIKDSIFFSLPLQSCRRILQGSY